jgi:hypothetical protein
MQEPTIVIDRDSINLEREITREQYLRSIRARNSLMPILLQAKLVLASDKESQDWELFRLIADGIFHIVPDSRFGAILKNHRFANRANSEMADLLWWALSYEKSLEGARYFPVRHKLKEVLGFEAEA